MGESPSPTPNAVASSSSWSAFLKSVASFNGDLSSLTAPPFILSATSLTEFSSYWSKHPHLLAAPASEPDPARRALLVVRWFLATLKQQYASRSEQYGNEKKPLNPFLGELFLGKWDDPDSGSTELISEQVSHHPPATAYSITNHKSGVHLEGYNAQKATFTKTINVKQIGHAVLTVPTPDGGKETFLVTLPSLHIEGLIFGVPFVELDGSSSITSSSGLTARIEYSGKGWLSGKKNSVTVTVHKAESERDVVFSGAGQWTGTITFREGRGGKTIDTLDCAAEKTSPLLVRPVEEQYPLESRRAWSGVAAAVAKGDMDAVGVEKSRIERAQREMRAKEKAEGRVWERRYFSAVESEDEVLAVLGPRVAVSVDGDAERTGGLWRFDGAKASKAKESPPLSQEETSRIEKELLGH